jgi:hydrogenase-4 component B
MGALGISGIPMFSGYISKTLLHESIVEYQEVVAGTSMARTYVMVEWLFLLSGGLTIAYMLKLFIAIFVEKNDNQNRFERLDKSSNRRSNRRSNKILNKKLDIKSSIKYMNGKTSFALVGAAIVIPILGFLPSFTMDKIATATQSFVNAPSLEHPIHYFNLTNLSGSMISIGMGVLIYAGFVRTLLMRKGAKGRKEYVDIWPKWMDLEDVVYRPLLQNILPFVLAVICRFFDKFMEAIIFVIRKYILGPKKNRKSINVGTRFTYVLGTLMDDIVKIMNKTLRKRRPIKISFVEFFAVSRIEMNRTNRLVTKSVSFSLLLFCIGLLLTLVYLLAVS